MTRRSFELIVDLLWWSVVSVAVFGLVSYFLASRVSTQDAAYYILLGVVLWEVVRLAQYSVTVGTMTHLWSRNLSNMFATPLTVPEYFTARMVTGGLKAGTMFLVGSGLAWVMVGFNIFQLGAANLAVFFVNLCLFSWATGLMIMGVIFRYGNRLQALAWSAIVVVQPLSAAFFPVDVLPQALQWLAYALPPTYVFEAARAALDDPGVNWVYALIAVGENLAYFALGTLVFRRLYRGARMSGQFVRNES